MKPEKAPVIADGQIRATVPLEAFREAVRLVSACPELRGNAVIPVLSCVIVAADAVEFRGCDISVRAPFAGGEGSGRVLLPASPLVAVLGAMDAGELVITKGKSDKEVTLACGDVSARIIPLPVADAPDAIAVEATRSVREKGSDVTVDAAVRMFALGEGVFASLMALTTPFISREEGRYYLNGVAFLSEDGERLRAVATDGHRLGSRDAGLSAKVEPFPARIIPRDLVTYLAKTVGRSEVRVYMSTAKASFAIEGVVVTGKLIDGTFPDFRRVVPAVKPDAIVIDVKGTARLIGAAKKFSRERGRAVIVEPLGDGVRLTVKTPDAGEMTGKVTAAMEGRPAPRVGFNGSYLSDILRAFRAKRLRFQIDTDADHGHGNPCRITDPDAPDAGFAVLMPMRV